MHFEMQLNKSFSAPDISCNGPLFRRVIIDEHFHSTASHQNYNSDVSFASSRLFRHNSYGQLTYAEFAQHSVEDSKFEDLQESPMEVDQLDVEKNEIRSEQSLRLMDNIDLTFRGSTPILRKVEKRKPIKKRATVVKTPKREQSYLKLNCILLIMIIISVTLYDKLYYTRIVDVESIRRDLEASVIGQNHAIQQLGASLDKFSSKSNSETNQRSLLALIGTTGVGKSLCVNIIKRQFKPKQTVEINVDLKTYHQEITKNVPYLVILDDLTFQKIPKVVNVLQALPEDKWILAITVFNIQETEDMSTFTTNQSLLQLIPKELHHLHFDFDMVSFESFRKDDILLEGFATVYRRLVDSVREWKTFVKQHNFETFGFKGLVEKMIAHST